MSLTKREKQYLAKKLSGGSINEQGNTYEKYFAIHEIVSNTNKHLATLRDVFISTQVEAFVDDLLVLHTSVPEKTFYQLKSSQTLLWGKIKKLKSLAFDFNKQRKIEQALGNAFSLQLVVAQPKVKTSMEANLPSPLKACTTIRLFPYWQSINQQLKNDPDFRKEIEALCAFPDLDKLEALAAHILGKWEASNKKNICLQDLINSIRANNQSFIKAVVPAALSRAFEDILRAIPGFSYKEIGGYLEWEYGPTLNGSIPHPIDSAEFRNIEQSVISNHPTDYLSLDPLIS